MKKLIAGGVVASALALGSLTGGAAHADYGQVGPSASVVKHDVNKAVKKKGHVSKKKAKKLKAEVKAAYKAGVISKKVEKKLLAKIKKDAK